MRLKTAVGAAVAYLSYGTFKAEMRCDDPFSLLPVGR